MFATLLVNAFGAAKVIALAPRGRVQRLLDDLQTAMAMPRVDIVVSRGSPAEDRILLELRGRIGSDVRGRWRCCRSTNSMMSKDLANLRYARRRVKRASRLGHKADLFAPNDRRSELLAIHRSLPERQGRPMAAVYLDRPRRTKHPHR